MNAAANKQLVQDIFDKVAVGDSSLFVASLADNVTMRVTGRNSWSRTFQGKHSLLRELYGYLNTLTQKPRKTLPLRFFADDDHVVLEARGDMATKSGAPYENEYCLIFRLVDGKIVEMREYMDSALCERVLGNYPTTAGVRATVTN